LKKKINSSPNQNLTYIANIIYKTSIPES